MPDPAAVPSVATAEACACPLCVAWLELAASALENRARRRAERRGTIRLVEAEPEDVCTPSK